MQDSSTTAMGIMALDHEHTIAACPDSAENSIRWPIVNWFHLEGKATMEGHILSCQDPHVVGISPSQHI
jgi:hypothetical protein